MPRIYTRKLGGKPYASYDKDDIKNALIAIKQHNLSIKKASEIFNVNRSTLSRRLRGIHVKKIGGQTSLTEEEEILLVHQIKKLAEWGFGITCNDLRLIVQSFIKYTNRTSPFKDGLPGPDWVAAFRRRHADISLRTAQNLPANRAFACNKQVVEDFFEKLTAVCEEHDLFNKPAHIFNCDESGFQTDVGSQKLLCRRGMKNPHKTVASSTKSMFTVMECASADGKFLPPYIVYKGKHLYQNWCQDGPDDCCYNVSPSGWMESQQFVEWFKKVFISHTKHLSGTKLLILDGHSSHLSTELVDIAKTNCIEILCLPAHTSHILQPLDVGVYKAAKSAWRKIVMRFYEKTTFKNVDKSAFPALMKELHQSGCFSRINAINSFEKCGIYPINKNKITEEQMSTSFPLTTETPETVTQVTSETKSPTQVSEPLTPKSSIEKALLHHFREKIIPPKVTQRKRVRRTLAECLTNSEIQQRMQEGEEKVMRKNRSKENKEPEEELEELEVHGMEGVEELEVEDEEENKSNSDNELEYRDGSLVCAIYDHHWYIAEVLKIYDDSYVKLKYMQLNSFNSFNWPQKEDIILTLKDDVLFVLQNEDIIPVSNRFIGLDKKTLKLVETKFKTWLDE